MNLGQLDDLTYMFGNLWDEHFKKRKESTRIKAEFYPYTSLKSTIRRRENLVFIRISDMLKDAPLEVICALGVILFCKLERRPPPKKEAKMYKDYANSKKMQNRISKFRKIRGKKVYLGPKGEVYDLKESFDRVNRKYFKEKLKAPSLTWSLRKTKTRFGHHDDVFNTIVISRTLDNKRLPSYLLDYVMYHEMLHMKHERSYKNGRRSMHTKVFKEDEKKFHNYKKAKALLKEISGRSHYLD
ncbi:MAG: M48 family metallopeptidase [Thermoplasmata archaeon]|nr:MAG: M48 family metallopeptidase [Thermoplasmata archaeon]